MEIIMIDKERVIKALEKGIRITESVDGGWVHITIEEAKKALELLKGEKDAGQGESDKPLANHTNMGSCRP